MNYSVSINTMDYYAAVRMKKLFGTDISLPDLVKQKKRQGSIYDMLLFVPKEKKRKEKRKEYTHS